MATRFRYQAQASVCFSVEAATQEEADAIAADVTENCGLRTEGDDVFVDDQVTEGRVYINDGAPPPDLVDVEEDDEDDEDDAPAGGDRELHRQGES